MTMGLSFDEELGLFHQVVDYMGFAGCLKSLLGRCHSQEELDTVKEAIPIVKDRLMSSNPEFRSIMDSREQAVKLKAEYEQAIHRANVSTARNDAQRQHTEALARIPKVPEVDDWVANTRYKTYKPELKEKQLERGLWCPICQNQDKRGNMVNGKPTCTECWHELVPKNKLRDYSRKYRRAWKKK